MEDIIKKIEQFQSENKEKWIELMELDTEAMQLPMARLIGAMTSQIDIIKNELKNN